ncbi:MAG: hypothetical protein EXS35_07300 [Pedosphaera sp.]|nr:hypothetical protein [Pedosphaera sp.]
MHTLADIATALNRSPQFLRGVQARFELPAFEGAGYSSAYFALLRTIVYLRALNITDESLRELWHIEKKLLQLLHADSTGSPTWFLDSCGATAHPKRRLLLTHYDLGVEVPAKALQLGLNFAEDSLPELFAGADMGADALRVLGDYLKLYSRIRADLSAQDPLLREAMQWATHLP